MNLRPAACFATLLVSGMILTTNAPTAMAWGCLTWDGSYSYNYSTRREAEIWATAECKAHEEQSGQRQNCHRIACSPSANTLQAAQALRVK